MVEWIQLLYFIRIGREKTNPLMLYNLCFYNLSWDLTTYSTGVCPVLTCGWKSTGSRPRHSNCTMVLNLSLSSAFTAAAPPPPRGRDKKVWVAETNKYSCVLKMYCSVAEHFKCQQQQSGKDEIGSIITKHFPPSIAVKPRINWEVSFTISTVLTLYGVIVSLMISVNTHTHINIMAETRCSCCLPLSSNLRSPKESEMAECMKQRMCNTSLFAYQ
jgi:hypothetical protein